MRNAKNTIFLELRIIKEYWQIISVVTTVIFFGVYFYLENKEARETVEELRLTNKELKDRISRLEGQVDVINSNMVLFVEKNPGLTTYRLEMLEEQMDVRFLLDALEKKRDTEIKIIQVPAPTLSLSLPNPATQEKTETKQVEPEKTPVKSRRTKKND
jgi:hypothetical protein